MLDNPNAAVMRDSAVSDAATRILSAGALRCAQKLSFECDLDSGTNGTEHARCKCPWMVSDKWTLLELIGCPVHRNASQMRFSDDSMKHVRCHLLVSASRVITAGAQTVCQAIKRGNRARTGVCDAGSGSWRASPTSCSTC